MQPDDDYAVTVLSGKTEEDASEEKQAEKPIPEANRYVGEWKLGVGAEK